MKDSLTSRKEWWAGVGQGVLCLTLASQVNIELFTSGFRISAAVMMFPIMLLFLKRIPLIASTLAAAPLIVGIRVLIQWLGQGSAQGSLAAYWPEAVFIICYALLFAGYCYMIDLQPFRVIKFLPLILIDTLSNLLEMVIRMKAGEFYSGMFLNLLWIGIGRSIFVMILVWAVYSYGVKVLSRTEAERYRNLLLLTADLKNELVLMKKSGDSIENSMQIAYRLYGQLRLIQEDMADDALLIAKDIHEVKKEYAMVMKGMKKSLELQSLDEGMFLEEIWDTIEPGITMMAREMEKRVTLKFSSQNNLYTGCHYILLSVFRNLLWNAVEAAGTEPVMLEVIHTQQNDIERFLVRDNCGGIKEEYREDIFKPGFSTKINYETGDVQRGLGLSMVKDLVEIQLHGSIDVQTEEGGSTFIIEVPQKCLNTAENRGS